MKRFIQIAPIAVVILPLVVLIPIGQVMFEWIEIARLVPASSVSVTERGFDWVFWQDNDGTIEAAYVLPEGPASSAGIQQGDVFFSLDQQQYFNVEQLQEAIEGIPPGSQRSFVVLRGEEGEALERLVRFTRYPTFLYPLSASLWQFSIWSFTLAAFFHVLGLLIIAPVALRSRRAGRARYSLMLILSSSLWIFGNWLRLIFVEGIGPPSPGSRYDLVFQWLTYISLIGWIGFPAILLRKVLSDTHLMGAGRLGRIHYLIYLPMAILGMAATIAAFRGSLGPFSLTGLIAPIIFYACCYVALAAALILTLYVINPEEVEEHIGGWSRTGSAVTLVVSSLMALLALGVLPLFGSVPDITAGWLIVCAQLLSLAPVMLVSFATLRQGKIDQVLTRGLTYLTVLGLIFFAFIGGLEIMQWYVPGFYVSQKLVAASYVVVLLFVFERVARRLRLYATRFFATERQALRKSLSRYQEQMGNIMFLGDLAQRTVQVLGPAFDARSALLFIRPTDAASTWTSGAYHPEAPFLTERIASSIWETLGGDGRIWSSVPELNESEIPYDIHEILKQRRAVIAVPIMVDESMEALLVMGPKMTRRTAYNIEDIDLLRGLSGQLALAIERLLLVEREKTLIRVSAEAELKALRAQINPHFLFNALNTIISLIEERPEEAEETVQHLAAIFRHILQTSSSTFITLENELKLVNHYLSIEKARFGDKLRVKQRIEPELLAHPVPAFVIQTLVENAIKHGLEKKRGSGVLNIIGRTDPNGAPEILIKDSGVGIPSLFENGGDTSFFGLGLQNIATRLEKLYNRSDLLRIRSSQKDGTEVKLLLPYRVNGEDELVYPHTGTIAQE